MYRHCRHVAPTQTHYLMPLLQYDTTCEPLTVIQVGILLQADILPEVYNYYIGDGENCETTYSELDEDELDEETGDEEEIDLEAEEENAKKRRRT